MKAIIIGAGRGRRLMPLTEDTPKCFAKIGEKRILDLIIEAWRTVDVEDFVFIGGYQIEKIQKEYPDLRFYYNHDWQNNNILASLFCAEAEMNSPFACTYADIIYRPWVTEQLLKPNHDISLVVDVDWRERYVARTMHPEDDAEKVLTKGHAITRISREILPEEADGEYIGVAMFSQEGAKILCQHYHRAVDRYSNMPFHGAVSLQKAYLIQLFQEMIKENVKICKVEVAGGYHEIDTTQDYEIANKVW